MVVIHGGMLTRVLFINVFQTCREIAQINHLRVKEDSLRCVLFSHGTQEFLDKFVPLSKFRFSVLQKRVFSWQFDVAYE